MPTHCRWSWWYLNMYLFLLTPHIHHTYKSQESAGEHERESAVTPFLFSLTPFMFKFVCIFWGSIYVLICVYMCLFGRRAHMRACECQSLMLHVSLSHSLSTILLRRSNLSPDQKLTDEGRLADE